MARATSQKVVSTTPNLDFGVIPVDTNGVVEQTVTYANDGAAETTLTLAATMREAEDTLTLSAPTVTVPAGGTASVTVTLHPDDLAKGGYTGAVVATGPSGLLLTTPVGLRRGPKKVPLTVRIINRYGNAPGPMEFWTAAAAVDVPDTYGAGLSEYLGDGAYRYMVEPGTYSVQGGVQHQTTDGGPAPVALLYNPEVVVPEQGAEVILDAREAVPLRFKTPKPIDWRHSRGAITSVRTAWDGSPLASGTMGMLGSNDLYVSPTKKVTKESSCSRSGPRRSMTNCPCAPRRHSGIRSTPGPTSSSTAGRASTSDGTYRSRPAPIATISPTSAAARTPRATCAASSR